MDQAVEETRLQALAGLNILDTPREERFDRIVRLTQRLFDVPTALITLVDEDRQFHKAEVGFGAREIPRDHSFCSHALASPSPMVVTDAEHDDRFRDNPLVTGEGGVRFYAGQPVTTPAGVPVGALCILDKRPRELSDVQLEMLTELAGFVETELARTDELDRARDVQRNLLPRTPPVLPGYEVAGVCLPAAAVGGDFYDWHEVDEEFQVSIADVMGKGIPAALIGTSVRSVLRGASRFNDLETAVNRTAVSLESDLSETSTFVTLLAARLDPRQHTLTYVDAGHGIAGVVSATGDVRRLESTGLPLGVPGVDPWHADTLRLEPGDTFICFSDGLLDLFGTLEQAIEAARQTVVSYRSAHEIVDKVAAYSRQHHATDDVTAVVVRRTP
ncbi:MAG TPA: GAF domain-containing SpoIIE family protein phosphatase [Nocardioidaceae bacterium]|nr:GAF domain-containing SpoIIE family protein phosphatase [Nocardioidaceae bacterium]